VLIHSLKGAWFQTLTLERHILVSNVPFKFNQTLTLERHILVSNVPFKFHLRHSTLRYKISGYDLLKMLPAGAYNRPLYKP
jgi:hypothetical protein